MSMFEISFLSLTLPE